MLRQYDKIKNRNKYEVKIIETINIQSNSNICWADEMIKINRQTKLCKKKQKQKTNRKTCHVIEFLKFRYKTTDILREKSSLHRNYIFLRQATEKNESKKKTATTEHYSIL